MPESPFSDNNSLGTDKKPRYKVLAPNQLGMIDEALSSLGEYGEVRLIVSKGRLRFIVTEKSYDVLKWQPGSLA